MKSLRHLLLTAVLVIAIVFVVITHNILIDLIGDTSLLVRGVFSRGFDHAQLILLESENLRLKADLAEQNLAFRTETINNIKRAELYSRYPFSGSERIVMNLGERDGVTVGAPVLTSERYLLGVVTNVRAQQSEVATIFDISWRSSVSIGSARIKAVLQGRLSEPNLELIERDQKIYKNDVVRNISPEFPLNQIIGYVNVVIDDPNSAWMTGTISVPYDISALKHVFVVTEFP